jgi:hypothetical protein
LGIINPKSNNVQKSGSFNFLPDIDYVIQDDDEGTCLFHALPPADFLLPLFLSSQFPGICIIQSHTHHLDRLSGDPLLTENSWKKDWGAGANAAARAQKQYKQGNIQSPKSVRAMEGKDKGKESDRGKGKEKDKGKDVGRVGKRAGRGTNGRGIFLRKFTYPESKTPKQIKAFTKLCFSLPWPGANLPPQPLFVIPFHPLSSFSPR